MKRYLLSLIAILLTSLCGHAQDFAQYKQNLDWQVYNYPQEKIHVMTDKPYYITGDTVWLRAFVVNAVDTTAAGDTFCGAFCVALTKGFAMADAIRMANKAASVSVTRRGAQPSVPTAAEVF